MKKERRCPCGAKLLFSECWLTPKEGMVGPELKIKIEKTILEIQKITLEIHEG